MKKILTLAELPAWRQELREQHLRLVVTNGVFDLLHRGHAEYLQKAAALGDRLLICINSDQAVKKLKGPSRPVNQEQDRAFMLNSLQAVDAVVIFDNVKATDALRLSSPDIYVKGGDYTEDTLDREEYAVLQQCRAEIRFIPFVGSFSTSNILHCLRDNTTLKDAPATGAAPEQTSLLPEEFNFLYSRRSIRAFQPRPVQKDLIHAILSAGAAAPSARRQCPWHFLAVTRPETLAKMAEMLPNGPFLKDCPAAVIVCGDLNQACGNELSYLLQDCAAAIENILLAINARNLGGCWLGIHPRQERDKALREYFSLPNNIVPVGAVAFGWPAEEKSRGTKLKEEMIHWETFN